MSTDVAFDLDRALADLSGKYHLTELGNAHRLVRQYGDRLRYVPLWKKWLWWDGTRWVMDTTEQVTRCAKATVISIYAEAASYEDETARKLVAKWAEQSEAASSIRALTELARSEPGVAVPPSDLDADDWLLNCRNGTLDLRTGDLRPHRREDMITKLAPVAYDAAAVCPQWDAFLDRIMGGNAKLIYYLQKAVGYSLTGETREQCVIFLYGSGANGKSTFVETLKRLLGDYARHTAPSTLMVKQGEAVPNDVAALVGARFVAAIETEDGKRLAEAQIKQLTGGDTVTTRRLYQEWFEFRPTFKIWLATNHVPAIRGTDHAIWRRIRLIPFTVAIPECEQDLEFPDKLAAELPGILRWAVAGCLAWQQEGLGVPNAVREATEAYRHGMDALAPFLEAWCVVRGGERVRAADLYDRYHEWVTDEEARGEHTDTDAWMTKTEFGHRLKERGLLNQKIGGQWYWLGVRLKGH